MLRSLLMSFVLLLIAASTNAQYNFKCVVKDSATQKPISEVNISLSDGKKSASDKDGNILIKNIKSGNYTAVITHVGYSPETIVINIPQPDSLLVVYMDVSEQKEEEVIVSSSRTNSRIEDLPTKVEVLGSEEVGEENGIKPGNIASLLGDIAGIQIQQTSVATGNSEARVQGLPGKYTQLLRDGMPLFGGYSGSFGILQIPPLDLKQIELVKGSASTLYGGGAIAGMINLVSKSPVLNKPEHSVTINHSSLNESNLNFFLSDRKNKFDYTLFAGGTYQKAVDVNKDGFSDVPDLKTFFFHPRLFFYPNKMQTITLGYILVAEDRNGGDMQVLHYSKDSLHQYFDQNKSWRNTIDASFETKLNKTDIFLIKGTTSFYSRDISTNVFGMGGNQLSYYTEISYFKKMTNNNLVAGFNFSGENFTKKQSDSTNFENYKHITTGLFVQDDWRINSKLTAQGGFRFDNTNAYGNFLLPRLSVLYKINSSFTTRLGGGLGYKIPTMFDIEVDERDLPKIVSFSSAGIVAEKSSGINWDINYKHKINGWNVIANQMFYITDIQKPVVDDTLANGMIVPYNAPRSLNTKGSETYLQLTHNDLEIYFGYTYTDAMQLFSIKNPYVSLSARNKFASVVAYNFSEKFRAVIEASYTGKQYLDDGSRTPSYFIAAMMMRNNVKNISFVLNCENLFDYRQTKKENIVIQSGLDPIFKQLWAPIDGRVVNLSVKLDW